MNSSFNDYKTPVSSQSNQYILNSSNNNNTYYYSHSRKPRSHSEESPLPPMNPLQNKKAFLKKSIRPQSALSYSRKNDCMNKSTSYNHNKQQISSEIDKQYQQYGSRHLEMCSDAIRLDSAIKKSMTSSNWQKKSFQAENTTNKKNNSINNSLNTFDPSSSQKQQQQQPQQQSAPGLISSSSSAQKLTPEQYKQCRLAQFLSRTEDSLKKTIDAQNSLETTQINLTDCISQAKKQLQTSYETAMQSLDKERSSMLLWLESIQNSNNAEITKSTSSLILLRNELEQFKLDVSSNIEDIILHMQTRPFDEIIRKYLSRIAEIDDLRDRSIEQQGSSSSSYNIQFVSVPSITMLPPPYLPSIVQVNKSTYPLHSQNMIVGRNLQNNSADARSCTSKLQQSAQIYNSLGHKGGNINKFKAAEKQKRDHNNNVKQVSSTGYNDSINAQFNCNNRAQSPWELQNISSNNNNNNNFGRKSNKNQQSQSFSSSSVYPTHFSSQITCHSDLNPPSMITDTHCTQSSQFDNEETATPVAAHTTTTHTFANNNITSQQNNLEMNNKRPNSLQKHSVNSMNRSYDQQQQYELKENNEQVNNKNIKQLYMNRSVDISNGITTSCGYQFVPHSGGVSKKKIAPCELEMAKPYELNNQLNSLREQQQQQDEEIKSGKEYSDNTKDIGFNEQHRYITENNRYNIDNLNNDDSHPQGQSQTNIQKNQQLTKQSTSNAIVDHVNSINDLSQPHHSSQNIATNQPKYLQPNSNRNKQTIESSHRADLINRELSRRSQFESLHENFGQSINEFISEEPQSRRMIEDQQHRESQQKERYISSISGQSRQQQCKQAQHSLISQSIKINSAFNSSLSHFQSSTIDRHNLSGNSNPNKSQLNGFTLSQEGEQSSSVYSEVLRSVQPKQHRNSQQTHSKCSKSIHNNQSNSQNKRHNKSSNTKTHNSSQIKQREQQLINMNSIGAVNDSHFDSMQTDFNDNDDKENLHISNTENMMH